MKISSIAVALALLSSISPVFGQQPTDKPEIPAPHGAVFAEVAYRPIAEIGRTAEPALCFRGCFFDALDAKP